MGHDPAAALNTQIIAKEGDSMDYTNAPINQEELVRIRRQLHMYPELKWDLPLTAALVKGEKVGTLVHV